MQVWLEAVDEQLASPAALVAVAGQGFCPNLLVSWHEPSPQQYDLPLFSQASQAVEPRLGGVTATVIRHAINTRHWRRGSLVAICGAVFRIGGERARRQAGNCRARRPKKS